MLGYAAKRTYVRAIFAAVQLTLDFDREFDVVLRNAHGNKLDSHTLSYENPKFCFQGYKDGDYQLAFVLYKKGIPQPARVFPTRYRHNADKPNDVYYMIDGVCP